MSTAILTEHGVELDAGDIVGDDDLEGWWCLATAPFPCPASGCEFVADYVTAAHVIVVWPEKDDPTLLEIAAIAHRKGRDPRPVEYQASMGPCVAFAQWEALGRPVHAYKPS